MNLAAFFDLDGTLVPPPSLERRFLRYLWWRQGLSDVPATGWARWLARFCRSVWSDYLAATHGNKAHLAGVRCAMLEAWTAWLRCYPVLLFPKALERLEWHALQGHRIFLVTGTLQPLAEAVARQFPMPVVVCATELECAQGRWTGRVLGEAICGPAKAGAVERLAARYQLDLSRSYAYGDRYADCWMLERVGYAAAVNPASRLARLARRRGWPVLIWGKFSRRQTRPTHQSPEATENRIALMSR